MRLAEGLAHTSINQRKPRQCLPTILILAVFLCAGCSQRDNVAKQVSDGKRSSDGDAVKAVVQKFLRAYSTGDIETAETYTTSEHSPEFALTAFDLARVGHTYELGSWNITATTATLMVVFRIPLDELRTFVPGEVSQRELRLIISENSKPLPQRNLPPDLFGRSGRLSAVLDGLGYWLAAQSPPSLQDKDLIYKRQVKVLKRNGRWLVSKT
jgi:hypothetical protein